jgi:F-type H+-transporting ATPase subunit a
LEHGFTWVSIVPGLKMIPAHTATALLVASLLILGALRARRAVAASPDAVIPDGTLTVRNAFEIYVEKFSGLVEGVVGPHSGQYVPFYATLFLFILASNLIGLIPGFSPPTSNVNITLALGVTSFVMYNYWGFKAHGIAYLKHFVGPIWWLAVLMVPLEIIDNCLRPVTLNLRLMMNMFADHLVHDIFTDLTKLVVPVVFLALGTFVSVIQAFVFTLLSLVYVALAVGGHDEH